MTGANVELFFAAVGAASLFALFIVAVYVTFFLKDGR